MSSNSITEQHLRRLVRSVILLEQEQEETKKIPGFNFGQAPNDIRSLTTTLTNIHREIEAQITPWKRLLKKWSYKVALPGENYVGKEYKYPNNMWNERSGNPNYLGHVRDKNLAKQATSLINPPNPNKDYEIPYKHCKAISETYKLMTGKGQDIGERGDKLLKAAEKFFSGKGKKLKTHLEELVRFMDWVENEMSEGDSQTGSDAASKPSRFTSFDFVTESHSGSFDNEATRNDAISVLHKLFKEGSFYLDPDSIGKTLSITCEPRKVVVLYGAEGSGEKISYRNASGEQVEKEELVTAQLSRVLSPDVTGDLEKIHHLGSAGLSNSDLTIFKPSQESNLTLKIAAPGAADSVKTGEDAASRSDTGECAETKPAVTMPRTIKGKTRIMQQIMSAPSSAGGTKPGDGKWRSKTNAAWYNWISSDATIEKLKALAQRKNLLREHVMPNKVTRQTITRLIESFLLLEISDADLTSDKLRNIKAFPLAQKFGFDSGDMVADVFKFMHAIECTPVNDPPPRTSPRPIPIRQGGSYSEIDGNTSGGSNAATVEELDEDTGNKNWSGMASHKPSINPNDQNVTEPSIRPGKFNDYKGTDTVKAVYRLPGPPGEGSYNYVYQKDTTRDDEKSFFWPVGSYTLSDNWFARKQYIVDPVDQKEIYDQLAQLNWDAQQLYPNLPNGITEL